MFAAPGTSTGPAPLPASGGPAPLAGREGRSTAAGGRAAGATRPAAATRRAASGGTPSAAAAVRKAVSSGRSVNPYTGPDLAERLARPFVFAAGIVALILVLGLVMFGQGPS